MKEEINLEEILIYITNSYPISNELTIMRMTNILFLVDWTSKLKTGNSLTKWKWKYSYDTLCSRMLLNEIKKNMFLEYKKNEFSKYFTRKYVTLKYNNEISTIDKDMTDIIDKVIEISSKMYDNELNIFTNNTYPLKKIDSFSDVYLSSFNYRMHDKLLKFSKKINSILTNYLVFY